MRAQPTEQPPGGARVNDTPPRHALEGEAAPTACRAGHMKQEPLWPKLVLKPQLEAHKSAESVAAAGDACRTVRHPGARVADTALTASARRPPRRPTPPGPSRPVRTCLLACRSRHTRDPRPRPKDCRKQYTHTALVPGCASFGTVKEHEASILEFCGLAANNDWRAAQGGCDGTAQRERGSPIGIDRFAACAGLGLRGAGGRRMDVFFHGPRSGPNLGRKGRRTPSLCADRTAYVFSRLWFTRPWGRRTLHSACVRGDAWLGMASGPSPNDAMLSTASCAHAARVTYGRCGKLGIHLGRAG